MNRQTFKQNKYQDHKLQQTDMIVQLRRKWYQTQDLKCIFTPE